jgi:hypothetical protein
VKRLHICATSAALATAVILTGCGSDLDHGTITSKQYEPEDHWTYQQPQYMTNCTTVNKVTTCSQTLTGFIPIPMTDPECWRLNLRDGKETGHVCVSKEAWNTAKKGDDW